MDNLCEKIASIDANGSGMFQAGPRQNTCVYLSALVYSPAVKFDGPSSSYGSYGSLRLGTVSLSLYHCQSIYLCHFQ